MKPFLLSTLNNGIVGDPINVITESGNKMAYTWFGRPNWVKYGTKYWIGVTATSPHGLTQHIVQYDSSNNEYTTTQIGTQYQNDDHNQGQILIRKYDNRLISFFTEHNGDKIRWKISTNPLDSTSWGSVIEYNPLLQYSYASPYQNSSGDIFLFVRTGTLNNATKKWYYIKSTDGGESFGPPVEIIDNGATQNYCITCQDGNKIHFVSTTGHPQNLSEGNISLYHFYFDMEVETFHKSDGTSRSIPFAVSGATPVNITTGNDTSWNLDITVKNGKPRILYVFYPNGRITELYEKELWFIEYDGVAWVNNTKIANTMSGNIEDGPIRKAYSYTGASRFVINRPDLLIMPKHVDGILELHLVNVLDLGNIIIKQLTFNSDVDNWRPLCLDFPKNNLLWLRKDEYKYYTDFEMSLLSKTLTF